MRSTCSIYFEIFSRRTIILLSLLFFCTVSRLPAQNQVSNGIIILNDPGFPFIFELNEGESQTITRTYKGKTINRTLTLESFKSRMETNLWFTDGVTNRNYYQVDILVNVSGIKATLYHRPYQMPQIVNGLRINIENVRDWDEHAKYAGIGDMKKQVRIAVCLEDEPWGPESIEFPVNNYRWRAAVYNNTWSGLVPFNQLYYHRGEDYGAIPDLLEVVSSINGKIISTPFPEGVKGSNTVKITDRDDISFTYAHMNYENIIRYKAGREVKSGEIIGKTGMTWDGRKSQFKDPHLHIGITVKDVHVASFPWLMEAYFRKYPDKAFAVAGGYRFAVSGEKVELDASRSFTKNNSPLAKIQWKLSNGRVVDHPFTSISYDEPGIYCEELTVSTKQGDTDKDFLYVTVFDPEKKRKIAYGWAYFYPVRGIKPGDNVIFWNRLSGSSTDVVIDFGDGSPKEKIKDEIYHSYAKSGNYVVTLSSSGPDKEPITLKMEVIVE